MENLIFLLATSFLLRLSPKRKIKNQFIGNTGCSALIASDDELETSTTTSGDQLYFHEFKEKTVRYGMICVELQNEYFIEDAEKMLSTYIDQLKSAFSIRHNIGIDRDADWNCETSRTIVDYWQDDQKKDWKVKGYTNGKTLAVLYVKNIGNADVTRQDYFLDSFHFNSVCS